MSANPGSRWTRGSRPPPSQPRGTLAPRGPRAGTRDNAALKARPTTSSSAGARSVQPGLSSRNGATRGPSRRESAQGAQSYRGHSRQIRNAQRPAISSPTSDARRDATTQEQAAYRAYMERTYTTLDEQRKQERKDAIRDGLLADPDKPTTLANAITILGTCQDMCAEHERVQRIVQFMVDDCEKVSHATKENTKVPSEDRMVKRYRRPAAGYEEQLPSDIRPPLVLKKTLDYLIDEIVGGSEPLANVHKFVWDRTRAIRNDFSIQQVTKVDELRIAISCFERIARFHILSLHQLAKASENSIDFDAYQEREQLNNTLLSLMYYYDDSRYKLVSPNEPEFRAYCIIFEIQDQRPDLEDRAQNWPSTILKDRRVQTALKLYAAAANASDAQGPLRPQAPNGIAQANTTRFFDLVRSPAVPYLMACVAEIYFNKVRRTALDTIWKAYKVKRGGKGKVEDWTLGDVAEAFGFDDEDGAQTYCEEHGFTVSEKKTGEAYVDLGSVTGRYLSDTNVNRKQAFSIHLVEQKRRGRTLPAVINGLTGAQAQAQGLLVEDYSDHEISSTANDETLFLPDGSSTDERAKEPVRTRTHSDAPKLQGKSSEEPSMISSYFSYLRPFQSPDQPKADNSTSTLSAKPSVSTSSQRINPYNPPLSSRRDTSTSSPFSSLNKSGSVPSPFESASKPDIKPPSLDPSKSFTSQAQSNLTSKAPSNSLSELLLSSTKARPTPGTNTPSSNSTFNSQPSPTPEPPKLKFGTSLSNATRTGNASQSEKKEDNNNNTTDLWAKSSPRATEQNVDELKPSVSTFPNAASTPYTSTPTPSPPAAAFGGDKESVSKTSQPPFSLFPASAPPKATSSIPTEPSDKPTSTPAFSFTQPLPQPPKPSLLAPPDNAAKLPEQPPFQPAPTITNQTLTAPPSSRSAPKPQSPASSIPQPAVTEAPDPRPAALDALAEGLLMEDQGLLQQFIEYTIGPIVHETFQEVEDERSWKRASEVRTVLLSKKYLRSWKDIAWKRKLMRRGKERRAIFAKSMQDMAKSSRQRHSQSQASLQPSFSGGNQDIDITNGQERSMPPPSQSRSDLERKSLPSDFEIDTLPNADSNKRKRQDPPGNTKEVKHSHRTPSQHHHKRSTTMVHPRRSGSLYAGFSQLDENAYLNDKVIRQAKRLAGQAKLDTTRGDYFALKARGVNPDMVSTSESGIKRTRVDEQIERVRKLLKPSPSEAKTSTPQSSVPMSSDVSASNARMTSDSRSSNTVKTQISPNDLIAQIRQVRESLAESTAWFQTEREKSERLSSSRSSEVTHRPASTKAPRQPTRPRTQDHRHSNYNPTPTRAQIRLERTKANGLLPPDWDWNKSVTEWKLRGGIGSPRPGASREQSTSLTPGKVAQQGKKPIGLAGVSTGGLGQRRVPVREESGVVFDDDFDDEEDGFDGVEEDVGDEYEDDEGVEEEYTNGYDEEYEDEYGTEEEDEVKEEVMEDEPTPARAVLKAQGNSADTAIDLD